MNEALNWLLLADKFSDDGDPKSMRGCARELFDLDPASAAGPAVMAEAAFYCGNKEEAAVLAADALELDKSDLRARMVQAFLAGTKFALIEEIKTLRAVVRDAQAELNRIERLFKELSVRLHWGRGIPDDEQALRENENARKKIAVYILRKAQSALANALYLAADPGGAAAAIKSISDWSEGEQKADLYSKFLFMQNYRPPAPNVVRASAAEYGRLTENITPYAHNNVKLTPRKRLRIGYVSPDFRLHAVAYFLAPLLKNFDKKNFAVYCYATGKSDAVTERLKHSPVKWRDLRGRTTRTAARIIAEDQIDILVDLAGHSDNNNLPLMARRPAPLQVTGIGYTGTVGLGTIDYILTDEITVPTGEPTELTEKPLRLNGCHLCYAPGAIREMPPVSPTAPVKEKGYVTFGCFNNFAKVTDETLCLWRSVMDRLRNSRLTIKAKICSISDGREILRERLSKLGFDLSRVDFRPYSPDYLESYKVVDIALDPMPYNGGVTTCEALYMGVPVITMRGRTHGSRFGASILTNANVKELVAENQMEYIAKILWLAEKPDLIQAYRAGLRDNLLQSRLMDAKAYMADLEEKYRQIWGDFCRESTTNG